MGILTLNQCIYYISSHNKRLGLQENEMKVVEGIRLSRLKPIFFCHHVMSNLACSHPYQLYWTNIYVVKPNSLRSGVFTVVLHGLQGKSNCSKTNIKKVKRIDILTSLPCLNGERVWRSHRGAWILQQNQTSNDDSFRRLLRRHLY